VVDLNKLEIENHMAVKIGDPSRAGLPARVDVHFRDLDVALIRLIGGADMVAGCVAWLSHRAILTALAGVPGGVSIVVQKEDFLRPDMTHRAGWTASLRAMYGRLKGPPYRHSIDHPVVSNLSFASDPAMPPVRCMGNHNSKRSPAWPRMHNKFLVFCKESIQDIDHDGEIERRNILTPYAVWTGSFNLSENACMSRENAVVLHGEDAARPFFDEWAQIVALSEPLDWETDWCEPEWRIGT